MNRKYTFVGIVFICLGLVFSSMAFAKDSKEVRAKKHFKAGLSLMDTNNYVVAAQEFESSVKLYPTKSGYFNLATCYYELKRYNDAASIIKRLRKEFKSEITDDWESEIQAFEQKLQTAIVPVEFKSNIDGAKILLDGKDIEADTRTSPILVDPGDHEVTVSAEGFDSATEVIRINEGQGKTVYHLLVVNASGKSGKMTKEEEEALKQNTTHPVHFKSDGKDEKKRKPRIGMAIAFSIGGATGLAAITTGIIHLSGVSKIRDDCGSDACENHGWKNSLDKMKKLGVATNVLISVSAVAFVTGTILAFVEGKPRKKKRNVSVAPAFWQDGGGLGLSTSF